MSTRGFVGFRTTKDRTTTKNVFGIYNHYDSYYSQLGKHMMTLYKDNTKDSFKKMFDSKTWIGGNSLEPQVKEFFDYHSLEVVNDVEFFNNPIMCEYAYLYNLETDELEIYKGFMDKPSFDKQKGKFLQYDNKKYYINCVLIATRDNVNELLPLFDDDDRVEKFISSDNKKEVKYTSNGIKKLLTETFLEKDISISNIQFKGLKVPKNLDIVEGATIEKATFSLDILDNVGVDHFKIILNDIEMEYGIYITNVLLDI